MKLFAIITNKLNVGAKTYLSSFCFIKKYFNMAGQDTLENQLNKFRNSVKTHEVISKPVIAQKKDMLSLKRDKEQRIKAMAEAAERQEKLEAKKRRAEEGDNGSEKPAETSMHTIYDIIKILKDSRKPTTIEELIQTLHLEFEDEKPLIEILKTNRKISYNPKGETFEFKPEYNVTNASELFDLVHVQYRSNLTGEEAQVGFEMENLKECVNDPTPFAEELISKKKVYGIRGKEDALKSLYYNDYDKQCEIEDEFKTIWKELRLPDEADLLSQMKDAGLKTMKTFDKKALPENEKPAVKKVRQSNRKQKISNTHLQ